MSVAHWKGRTYLRRIAAKAKKLMGRGVATPFAWLDAATRSEVLEGLTETMNLTVQTRLGSIQLYVPTPRLLERGNGMLAKEPDTISWIDGFREGSVFWDVGANVGVFSLYAAAKRGVSVLSFEPLAANFHVLSRNIQLNGFDGRATAYCIALSSATELGLLNMPSAAMGSALTQFGVSGDMSPYCDRGAKACKQGMIGFSIDDFMSQFRPPFPNYLKLDVDGLEWRILQGATRTLRDSRLRSLIVELPVSGERERDLAIELLQDCGFRLVSCGNIQGTETMDAANHLFER
ncbi:MAG TPA: FkbM family methyltransferase [Blastocatellia bacterium]